MRIYREELLHSASDLNKYLDCPHAVMLDLRKLRDPASLPERVRDDEGMALIAEAGLTHEADYLGRLRALGDVIEIASDGPLSARASATLDAMRRGASVIFQAAFVNGAWHGFVDFLRRVDTPSDLGDWSYEPVDTKLAREPRAKHLTQLSLYAGLIAEAQGTMPERVHLVLGDGSERSFYYRDFRETLGAAMRRYLAFVEDSASVSEAEPNSGCGLCGWRDHCADEWERIDHLSRVAGLSRTQAKKLRMAGIETLTDLAETPKGTEVRRIASLTFERLRAQAALQARAADGAALTELLDIQEGRGYARLPQPHPQDLFFDLEGDPLHPGGLEYLWGVHRRNEQGAPMFSFRWGHDRDAEQQAFEAMVDWFTAHVEEHPGAHIYHYANYEVSVVRRLAKAFASREDAVDDLLRGEKFVDLYAIVRHAIRTSHRNMSLKTLEGFFAEKREEDVTDAGASIVHYHRWREHGDQAVLDGILDYNRVDCVNTEGLRNWLVTLRPGALPWWSKAVPEPKTPAKQDEFDAVEAMREAVRLAARTSPHLPSAIGETLALLVDFHKRAKKPAQWAVFDRCTAADAELIDDLECLGAIGPAGVDWLTDEPRNMRSARYSFPPQETKLKLGADVLHAPTLMRLGTIKEIDAEMGTVTVRRKMGLDDHFPEDGSIIAGWPIDDRILAGGVLRNARALSAGSGANAIFDLLGRQPPRFKTGSDGPLVATGENLIEAATRCALDLDDGLLFIQGPPGTGKTFTSAHVIVSLIEAGQRIGVTSNSHKAINNLLARIEEVATERSVTFAGVKKASSNDPDSALGGTMIDDEYDNRIIEVNDYQLIGGTAYLFAREEMEHKVDYLFVDEAGQVSLGNMVAMAGTTRNIVLVGDQMQLPQPIQGVHPGESGQSALDYYLQGAATIAPDRGILLDTSWRMHPAICSFISEAVYEGRLKPHPDCARQRLLLEPGHDVRLKAFGLGMAAMSHQGCSQTSEEEAHTIRGLIDELLGTRFVRRDGSEGVIGLADVLVVAPYNAQVNLLRALLPDNARVGTVDKFQGQEAEVVLISMTSSSPEDLPRHTDFFYSKNRLNVAVSRARILSMLVMNRRLIDLNAKSVDELKLLNTLAWADRRANGDQGSTPTTETLL